MQIDRDEILAALGKPLPTNTLQEARLGILLSLAKRESHLHRADAALAKTKLALSDTMKNLYHDQLRAANTKLAQQGNYYTTDEYTTQVLTTQRDQAKQDAEYYRKMTDYYKNAVESGGTLTQQTRAELEKYKELTKLAYAANKELAAMCKELRKQLQQGSPNTTDEALRKELALTKRKLEQAVEFIKQKAAEVGMTDAMAGAMIDDASRTVNQLVRELHGWSCDAHAQGLKVDMSKGQWRKIEVKDGPEHV